MVEGAPTGRPAQLQAFHDSLSRLDTEADGASIGIEYVSAAGERSLRRITIRAVDCRGSDLYLKAICHERGAWRTFRADRIVSIFDLDGVIHEDVPAFLRDELGVSVTGLAVGAPKAGAEKPGAVVRRVAREGIRVLVAMAQADGHLHPEEIECILRYAGFRADMEGVAMTPGDAKALTGYVKRLRPSAEVIEEALNSLDGEAPEAQRLFLRHARAMVEADGRVVEEELALLAAIEGRIGAPASA